MLIKNLIQMNNLTLNYSILKQKIYGLQNFKKFFELRRLQNFKT